MPRDPFDEFIRRFMRSFRFEDFGNDELKRILKEFKGMEIKLGPGVSGFQIEIKDFGKGKPEVKVKKIGPRGVEEVKPKAMYPEKIPVAIPEPEEKREFAPITKMLETNTGKIERIDEVVLTMQIPGVKEEDVEVRPLGNTVEIVARKPTGEAYFAAFELPHDADTRAWTTELKDEMLIISFPRRRNR